jgi:hypothetical protein
VRPRPPARLLASTHVVRRRMSAGCVASPSSVVWEATFLARGRISATCVCVTSDQSTSVLNARWGEYVPGIPGIPPVLPVGTPEYPLPPPRPKCHLSLQMSAGSCRFYAERRYLHRLRQDCPVGVARPLPRLPASCTCRAERSVRRSHRSHDRREASTSSLQGLTCLAEGSQADPHARWSVCRLRHGPVAHGAPRRALSHRPRTRT